MAPGAGSCASAAVVERDCWNARVTRRSSRQGRHSARCARSSAGQACGQWPRASSSFTSVCREHGRKVIAGSCRAACPSPDRSPAVYSSVGLPGP
jgi:hypothetical protein